MTDKGTSSNLVSSVTYGPAGEMLSMAGTAVTETRTYNALGQLKTLVGLSGVNLQYNYSSTANNGQIASQYDVASETITYADDQLKRLSSASSSAGWGQSFSYDGFGNLTAKSALSGAPPVGVYAVDPATNRLTGTMYDSNGEPVVRQWIDHFLRCLESYVHLHLLLFARAVYFDAATQGNLTFSQATGISRMERTQR
jgi:hypothetical protein